MPSGGCEIHLAGRTFLVIKALGGVVGDDLKVFLVRNRIDDKTWEASGCSWSELKLIKVDYEKRQQILEESANLYANVIRKIPLVHSVRSRIKDSDHLIEKIVRKCVSAEEKYKFVTVENYSEVITDLVGIRALHLFKEDCFGIASGLLDIWEPIEKPIAYVRSGDASDLLKKYDEAGMDVKEHPKGYRSLHCIFSSTPVSRKVAFEVQVRTIFEEGWSEIDHTVRYPNFSDNELVSYFLAIFNRTAGSADEMGGFVKGLASALHDYQAQISQVKDERDASLRKIEDLIGQLEGYKEQGGQLTDTVEKLMSEVDKIKNEKTIADFIATTQAVLGVVNSHKKGDMQRSAFKSPRSSLLDFKAGRSFEDDNDKSR